MINVLDSRMKTISNIRSQALISKVDLCEQLELEIGNFPGSLKEMEDKEKTQFDSFADEGRVKNKLIIDLNDKLHNKIEIHNKDKLKWKLRNKILGSYKVTQFDRIEDGEEPLAKTTAAYLMEPYPYAASGRTETISGVAECGSLDDDERGVGSGNIEEAVVVTNG